MISVNGSFKVFVCVLSILLLVNMISCVCYVFWVSFMIKFGLIFVGFFGVIVILIGVFMNNLLLWVDNFYVSGIMYFM